MQNQRVWSLSLGKWAGVHVQIHMFFILFVAFTLYLFSQAAYDDGFPNSFWDGPVLLLILFCSVLWHEVAHAVVTFRTGGNTNDVILGPLGGLGPNPTMLEPPAELLVATAGPIANLIVCFLCAVALILSGEFNPAALMNPLAPEGLVNSAGILAGLKMVFWVNWLLVIANLIPAFPFDGARIVKNVILTGWPHVDNHWASEFCSRLAKVIAVLLLVAAFFVSQKHGNPLIPIWLPLVLLSIFVFFAAKNQDETLPSKAHDEFFMGYDFSEGYTSLDRTSRGAIQTEKAAGPLTDWFQKRREQRELRQKEIEANEDSRVDEILSQVHESGIDSLSEDERDLLDRVSLRYQNRRTENE